MFAEPTLANRLAFAKVPVRSVPHRDFQFLGLSTPHASDRQSIATVNATFPKRGDVDHG